MHCHVVPLVDLRVSLVHNSGPQLATLSTVGMALTIALGTVCTLGEPPWSSRMKFH